MSFDHDINLIFRVLIICLESFQSIYMSRYVLEYFGYSGTIQSLKRNDAEKTKLNRHAFNCVDRYSHWCRSTPNLYKLNRCEFSEFQEIAVWSKSFQYLLKCVSRILDLIKLKHTHQRNTKEETLHPRQNQKTQFQTKKSPKHRRIREYINYYQRE